MLTFDDPTHTYRWDGQRVPGVTSVLSPLTDYDGVPRSIMEKASARGKAVHAACQLHDQHELDEAALDPALAPYLSGWRNFLADYDCNWFDIEKPAYSKTMRFAGTPDREGEVRSRSAIVDIKTTATPMPAVGPQLAAYEHLSFGTTNKADRYAVYLYNDGTYLCKKYTDPSDFSVFASLLTLRTWCANHNVTPAWR